jgi:YjbE family integral membrane protein
VDAMDDILPIEMAVSFFRVALVDVALAGDNAIVIAMAAVGLPPRLRTRAIAIGIALATVLRILFASVTVQLLHVVGLSLIGGLLLFWVCWKMWRELAEAQPEDADDGAPGSDVATSSKTLRQAVTQIIVADVSMSLDNVLAVAGASREQPVVLVFGLIFSIGLMGFAAALLSNLLNRFRWIGYLGLLVILYIAVEMTTTGAYEVWTFLHSMET